MVGLEKGPMISRSFVCSWMWHVTSLFHPGAHDPVQVCWSDSCPASHWATSNRWVCLILLGGIHLIYLRPTFTNHFNRDTYIPAQSCIFFKSANHVSAAHRSIKSWIYRLSFLCSHQSSFQKLLISWVIYTQQSMKFIQSCSREKKNKWQSNSKRITEIIIMYSRADQKSISKWLVCQSIRWMGRRTHWVSVLSAKEMNLRLQREQDV